MPMTRYAYGSVRAIPLRFLRRVRFCSTLTFNGSSTAKAAFDPSKSVKSTHKANQPFAGPIRALSNDSELCFLIRANCLENALACTAEIQRIDIHNRENLGSTPKKSVSSKIMSDSPVDSGRLNISQPLGQKCLKITPDCIVRLAHVLRPPSQLFIPFVKGQT